LASLEAARTLVRNHEEGIRDAPSRRREGRYYTPELLVRFLAARVLEPLIERASARARDRAHACELIFSLRVLDPAAGAGAFLLGALEVLTRALVLRGEPPARASA